MTLIHARKQISPHLSTESNVWDQTLHRNRILLTDWLILVDSANRTVRLTIETKQLIESRTRRGLVDLEVKSWVEWMTQLKTFDDLKLQLDYASYSNDTFEYKNGKRWLTFAGWFESRPRCVFSAVPGLVSNQGIVFVTRVLNHALICRRGIQ